ncbi:MAG: phenylalanine 4-monooxygenase [Pseudonocardiales bacterium]|nr:phenylalanine 4-monooxygenase [Pseudonocardiales bacterium]MBW0010790.1 phenylalanine 4-monooxygenase [Pseudonocardiales bacterium]
MASPSAPPRFGLPKDHPGFHDPEYRERRARIAEVGAAYRRGDPIPDVAYSTQEDEVWRVVSAELAVKHREYACAEYLSGADRLVLPKERVPQLREVDERVYSLTAFHVNPVPGLVPTRTFYGSLAERTFLSTQYIRHHSAPFYTPEPDIVHEIIGHANMLASPVFAELYALAGQASLRATTDVSLDVFSRVFWFTLEFGVVEENGAVKAYGAGLLSSYGEIEAFRDAEIRGWDLPAIATQEYDITHYQPVLFAATSFERMLSDLHAFFSSYDDRACEHLLSQR